MEAAGPRFIKTNTKDFGEIVWDSTFAGITQWVNPFYLYAMVIFIVHASVYVGRAYPVVISKAIYLPFVGVAVPVYGQRHLCKHFSGLLTFMLQDQADLQSWEPTCRCRASCSSHARLPSYTFESRV